MANRRNFTRAIKIEMAKRCTRSDGQRACEKCGAVGVKLEAHHKVMDALESDERKAARKLTADDGICLCEPCHDEITAAQRKELARADAAMAAHLGIRNAPTLQGRPFAKADRPPKRLTKQCAGSPEWARRFGLMEDA